MSFNVERGRPKPGIEAEFRKTDVVPTSRPRLAAWDLDGTLTRDNLWKTIVLAQGRDGLMTRNGFRRLRKELRAQENNEIAHYPDKVRNNLRLQADAQIGVSREAVKQHAREIVL